MGIDSIGTSGAYNYGDYNISPNLPQQVPRDELISQTDEINKQMEEFKNKLNEYNESIRNLPRDAPRPLPPPFDSDKLLEKYKDLIRDHDMRLPPIDIGRGVEPVPSQLPPLTESMVDMYELIANTQKDTASRSLDIMEKYPSQSLIPNMRVGFDRGMEGLSRSIDQLKDMQKGLTDPSAKELYDRIGQSVAKLEAERNQLNERAQALGLGVSVNETSVTDKSILTSKKVESISNDDLGEVKTSNRGLRRLRNMQSGIRI